MTEQHSRMARVEAGATPGEFLMVLATEGEATDGHILSIEGGIIPERMPLRNSHINSPFETFGSVVSPRKDMRAEPPTLESVMQIEMDGEGAQAELRRDLAHMIDQGHVNAVSIRWDTHEATPRVDLPEDHPYRVEKSVKGAARNGLFITKWTAIEGSVVGTGADADALVAQAERSESEQQRFFWRSMAADAFDELGTKKSRRDARFLAGLGDEYTARVSGHIPDPEPTLHDVMLQFERVTARLDEWEMTTPADLVEEILPILDQESEARADQPDTEPADQRVEPEVADQQPPITLEDITKLVTASEERMHAMIEQSAPPTLEAITGLVTASEDRMSARLDRARGKVT